MQSYEQLRQPAKFEHLDLNRVKTEINDLRFP